MEVKLQLKHLIIVGIVVIYTFGAIFLELTNELYNPTLNVAFVYNKTNLFEDNEATNIWTSLEKIQTEYNKKSDSELQQNPEYRYDNIQLQNVNISSSMSTKLSEYAAKNEVIVLLGNSYNQIISEIIRNNPTTKFILIDSGYKGEFSNLQKIDIDYQAKFDKITGEIKANTETKKILYVDTKQEDDTLYALFENEMNSLNDDYDIIRYQVKNIDDKVEVKNDLLKLYDQGIDYVYVENQELNKVVIETTQEVQDEINTNLAAIDKVKEENKIITSHNQEVAKNLNIDESDIDSTIKESKENADNSQETKDESVTNSDTATEDEQSEVSETEENDSTKTETDSTKETEAANVIDADLPENELVELKEVPEEKFEQKEIKVIVNEETGIDGGKFINNNGENDTVVSAYIDLNIDIVLEETFNQIKVDKFENSTEILNFENQGLKYIKEKK